jgi:hypothetical protein
MSCPSRSGSSASRRRSGTDFERLWTRRRNVRRTSARLPRITGLTIRASRSNYPGHGVNPRSKSTSRFVIDRPGGLTVIGPVKSATQARVEGTAGRVPVSPEPLQTSATAVSQEPLLSDIGKLGGEERMRGAEGALQSFESALSALVRENPKAYGAGDNQASQERVVSELLQAIRASYLSQTVETLRREAGYVRILGRWVHRAVFTFIGFGVLLAGLLPFCAVSLMSASAWGWLPGALGLVAALALGIWILSRIRRG